MTIMVRHRVNLHRGIGEYTNELPSPLVDAILTEHRPPPKANPRLSTVGCSLARLAKDVFYGTGIVTGCLRQSNDPTTRPQQVLGSSYRGSLEATLNEMTPHGKRLVRNHRRSRTSSEEAAYRAFVYRGSQSSAARSKLSPWRPILPPSPRSASGRWVAGLSSQRDQATTLMGHGDLVPYHYLPHRRPRGAAQKRRGGQPAAHLLGPPADEPQLIRQPSRRTCDRGQPTDPHAVLLVGRTRRQDRTHGTDTR